MSCLHQSIVELMLYLLGWSGRLSKEVNEGDDDGYYTVDRPY